MSKYTDPTPDHSREREFKVILEDLQSQFRTFGEGLLDVRQRLEHVEEMVPKVDQIERDVATIKLILRPVTAQLSDHERRITILEKSH